MTSIPVIVIAIGLNLVIALGCFYGAWRLWQLRRSLGAIANALTTWEHHTDHSLNPDTLPPTILRGQRGTAQVRYHYQRLRQQIQQLRQVMVVISLLPVVGRRVRRLARRPSQRRSTSRERR
ncbi:hypothetical protein [Nodosilinea sp. P-1105]|uniref:hypothetical protein n=1 Tax=Nodosilinea sp. P-1105 TaxID=2546229 RepID=UPI00146F70F7|nr:hypothetical protein [Nodosilinea sp. P-1105]NMF84234.1 hypothetical protein [Nodosilinea sp. P-1105]